MLRVSIFLDANNFKNRVYEAIQKRPNKDFDFDKLVKILVGNRLLITVNYYSALPSSEHCYLSPYKEEKYLLDLLVRKRNFRVQAGFYDIEHSVEKGTDVNLSIDMLNGAYHDAYDVCILISADQDYKKVINTVRNMGKIVELALPEKAKAGELIKCTDYFIGLTNSELESCWINK
jgi:uncharacterized LabA/DUF88 family protein